MLSRIVTIQFTKAMNPSTITLANLFVQRQGDTGNWNTPINLNSDPRTKLTYDPLTDTATLDYSLLPQTEMPTDDYRIVVKSGPTGVTDLVGNELDGEFSGTFPSGNGVAGGDFVEDLGLQVLQAPILTTFQMTPATDTGIAGDQNTKLSQPQFIGQVFNSFPGTVANLQVYVEFSGLHGGVFDLGVGGGGRGFVGHLRRLHHDRRLGCLHDHATGAAGRLPVRPDRGRRPGRPATPARLLFGPGARVPDRPDPALGHAEWPRSTAWLPSHPSNYSSLQTLTFNVQDPVLRLADLPGDPAAGPLPGHRPVDRREHQQLLPGAGSMPTARSTDESQYITTATFVATAPTLTASCTSSPTTTARST